MSRRCNVFHCPRSDRTCLQELLQSLEGQSITVTVPGDVVSGVVHSVGSQGFMVGDLVIYYLTYFYFPLPRKGGRLLPYHAEISVEELGVISGRLSRIGRDYTVIVPGAGPLAGQYVVIPINLFTELTCEKDHEE
jgi:hypothetical protein